MSKVFVFSDDEVLCGELIACLQNLEMSAVAIATNRDAAMSALSYGAESVLLFGGQSGNPEDYVKSMAEQLQARGAEVFLVGDTDRGRSVAAQVAALCGAGMSSSVSLVESDGGRLRFVRSVYGGKVEQVEQIDGLQIATMARGKASAVKVETPSQDLETISCETNAQVEVVSAEQAQRSASDISEAQRIVCIGMGIKSKDDIPLAEQLAEKLDAELACTRPIASDREWMDIDRYIGLSGKVVAPELLIEAGVSGQIQHTIGIRDSKVIVAIDTNEKAPIFTMSDYGIVGDLYEAIEVMKRSFS